ncbi:relaxase/mobilization nuclease domain-containing protein [Acidithiobacillus sp. MC6.1]|nr:relaxase/mobilization nuclease domain-containing protein [Acidithiobacillus sp. MC6.1]
MKGMNRVKRGRGFRGVLNYVFGRDSEHKNAPGVLVGGNLSGHDPRTLAQEFGVTRNLRPDIAKSVWHNSLRLPAGESLTNDEWVKIADDYMRKMGFTELHPRCYVLHNDKEGQHVHIVASRIALDGSLYLGKNENLASTRIIQQLEIEHELTITKGPEYENGKIKMPEAKNPSKHEIEKAIRTGVKPPRLVLRELIDQATRKPKTAPEFVKYLENLGVIVVPNVVSTGRLNGFSFHLDGVSFKGSSLGDSYKWASLVKVVDYEQVRDSESLADVQRIARNRLAELERDAGNAAGTADIASSDIRPDSGQLVPAGPDGGGPGQGPGHAESDHGSSDPRSGGLNKNADVRPGTRQSAEVGGDGAHPAPESQRSKPCAEGLDGRSEGVENKKGRDAGADQQADAPVLGGHWDQRSIVPGLGVDGAGEVPLMAWNTRFKQASAAKRRAKEQPGDMERQAEYRQLVEAAHMADLPSYMESIGLDVKRDGVKDWAIDDQYRITRNPDNHFVWCSWDSARGGDSIAFCMEELGSTFQQALADLSGVRLVTVTKPFRDISRFPGSPPIAHDPNLVRQYLQDRGISPMTIRSAENSFIRLVDYQGTPAVAFCGLDQNRRLRSMTVRLVRPIQSWDGQKEITKIDVRHSDKSYPAIYRGGDPILPSDRSLWIVEGGTDGLAVLDWYRAAKIAAPGIIVSGGGGVRAFLDQPHVQSLVGAASTVYVALEREKSQETQIRTDADHQRQIQKIQGLGMGCEVVAWRPPVGSKDIAAAWKAGVLPDAHDPLAHMRQGGGGGSGSAPMPRPASPTSTSTFGPE